jgi:hypothetical protein
MSSFTNSGFIEIVKYVTPTCFALLKAVCLAKISFPDPGSPTRRSTLGGKPPSKNSSKPAIPVLTSGMLTSVNNCLVTLL